MTRSYYIEGESMVKVKGRSDCAIATLSELGLCSDPIQFTVNGEHRGIMVDAYGGKPPESQFFGAMASVDFTLVNFDVSVLQTCLQLSWGGSPAFGALGHAGALMGNGLARFAPGGINGNQFVGLNIISAIGNLPWRFLYSYLADNPITWPLGTEKSLVRLAWEAVPYSADPWNGGYGSYGVYIFDNTADT